MTPLWLSDEAEAATNGRSTEPWTANGVSIDTRTLEPGDLFIAIKGPNTDGHDYVEDAFAKGAAAAMVSRAGIATAGNPLLLVGDTNTGLEDLGRMARQRTQAKIIGVTGSIGKTGTKEALRRMLEPQGRTIATQGNLNNQWGLPLSLARMPADTQFGIFEMGMNHAGEIHALSMIAKPDVAIITNVESVHLEFFSSEQAIADAKAEIFAGMTPNGTAILNKDNVHYEYLYKKAVAAGVKNICSFGVHSEAQNRPINIVLNASCSAVTAKIDRTVIDYSIGLPGNHWVQNSIAVLTAVNAVGGDVIMAARIFSTLRPLPGRGARQQISLPDGQFLLIDESYNASPASVRAALRVLGAAKVRNGGRRIAVLGDMLELGADAPRLHADLSKDIIENKIDLVFTAGENMSGLAKKLPKGNIGSCAPDSGTAALAVVASVHAGDVVMVKGSLGSRMAQVVTALQSADVSTKSLANGA